MAKKVAIQLREDVVFHDFEKVSGVRSDMDEFLPSMTRQEFAAECDINTLMARYEAGGAISHVNKHVPMFLDTTEYPTLQGAMDLFRQAAVEFNALPAKVRREFNNDPQEFVDFAVNPDNLPRMREWGLAAPEAVPDRPIEVRVIPDPPVELAPGGAPKPA